MLAERWLFVGNVGRRSFGDLKVENKYPHIYWSTSLNINHSMLTIRLQTQLWSFGISTFPFFLIKSNTISKSFDQPISISTWYITAKEKRYKNIRYLNKLTWLMILVNLISTNAIWTKINKIIHTNCQQSWIIINIIMYLLLLPTLYKTLASTDRSRSISNLSLLKTL